MTFRDLSRDLRSIMRRGTGEPLLDEDFRHLALRVFRFQCRANLAYGGFVARRGVDPEGVTRWQEIPFLPTRAFKATALVSGEAAKAERIFRTSGTTRGMKTRGEHHVLDLDLYRSSLLGNFTAHVLPGLPREVRVLCLLPSPEKVPDSSLSFMMGEVIRAVGTGESGFFVEPDGGLNLQTLQGALQEAAGGEVAVLVVGTAFAFVRWLEEARTGDWHVCLPRGSRILETGGYKGRTREVPRADLYRDLSAGFGVAEDLIVNEYGMTELLSQFYEPILGEGRDPAIATLDGRYHRGPPWVRTLVLDPLTLEILPPGEVGVLAHLDLANLGSVASVLTEDLGYQVPGGFRLLGRSPGSEPRGCSLAMEDFLASQAEAS